MHNKVLVCSTINCLVEAMGKLFFAIKPWYLYFEISQIKQLHYSFGIEIEFNES